MWKTKTKPTQDNDAYTPQNTLCDKNIHHKTFGEHILFYIVQMSEDQYKRGFRKGKMPI